MREGTVKSDCPSILTLPRTSCENLWKTLHLSVTSVSSHQMWIFNFISCFSDLTIVSLLQTYPFCTLFWIVGAGMGLLHCLPPWQGLLESVQETGSKSKKGHIPVWSSNCQLHTSNILTLSSS